MKRKVWYYKARAILSSLLAVSIFIMAIISGQIVPSSRKELTFKTYKLEGNYLSIKNTIITTKEAYNDYINGNDKLDFKNYDYLVVVAENDYCGGKINGIRRVELEDDVNITIGINATCGPCAPIYESFLLEVDKGSLDNKEIVYDYFEENERHCDPNVSYKPMIYLYPKKEMNVSIKLVNSDKLLFTYPKYEDGWDIYAYPSGDIVDKSGRTYYGLYWEGTNTSDNKIKDGFVVKGEDTTQFLEEKLSILGLNEREANEFIIYWLPILENNKYNYIRFKTIDEINKDMPIVVNPKPDSMIRILMEVKPLDEYIKVTPQKLTSPKRIGFSVVEWGGTILNK